MASGNLNTLLLAREHFDPSNQELVAKIPLRTKSTPYFTPEPGRLCLLAGDAGARVMRLGSFICDRGKNGYWAVEPVADDDPATNMPIRDLCPAKDPFDKEGEEGEDQPTLFHEGNEGSEEGDAAE